VSKSKEEDYYVCEFTIIRDTREQAPFHFTGMEATKEQGGGICLVQVIDRALKTGDYAIEGLEERVTVERKSIPDLLNCLVGDRTRFKKQLERLNQCEIGHVVVEGDWLSVFRQMKERNRVPRMALVSVVSWSMRHYPNVHWWFMPGKKPAEILTFRILEYAHKMRGLKLFEGIDGDGAEEFS
jgi:DNA excision repair protein ERCC-4